MQLVLLNSATLPRKWASTFRKKSSASSSKPPPSPRKSLHRSSSFSHPRSDKAVEGKASLEEEASFKVPEVPPSKPLSSFLNSPWKSKSFSDLKSQRDGVKMRSHSKGRQAPPPPPIPVRNSSCGIGASSRSMSHDSLVPTAHLPPPTASILNKSLRSTSWRNIFAASTNTNFGGMNRNHRLSQGPKKVAPPSVPEVKYPRSSCSSFGSDQNSVTQDPEEEEESFAPNRRLSQEQIPTRPQQAPSSSTYNSLRKIPKEKFHLTNRSIQEADEILKMDDQGIDMTLSPGRDSPGHDSNASSVTLGSASSGGCRNSTTSLDSGRASNSAAESIRSGGGGGGGGAHLHHPQIHAPHSQQRLSYQSSVGGGSSCSSSSSFRQSYHSSSSSSSVGSSSLPDHDGIYSLNVQDMLARGHPDHEILNSWLTDLHFEEYYDLFVSAGYDMPTISRMTPEDLTAIGIKKPNHRKRLKMEISKLNIGDGLPEFIPESLEEWLHCIRLSEYGPHLRAQGYNTVQDASQITIEDLEDVGLYRLGHQKRFLLAVKRNKDLKAGRRFTQSAYNPHHAAETPSYSSRPNEKCQFTSFQHPKYHPDVIRIETAAPVQQHHLPPDMPRPMPPLQMFSRANSFVPRTSYDDNDIRRSSANQESVLIHHSHHHHSHHPINNPPQSTPLRSSSSNGGDGTLPRPKGYVKPRPVAKIVAKTRETPPIETQEEEDLKKSISSSSSPIGSRVPSRSDGFRNTLKQQQFCSPVLDSSTSPPPPAPECDGIIPFANENAGTIRMRSGSNHIHDVSSYDWSPVSPSSGTEPSESPSVDESQSSHVLMQSRQQQQPQQQNNNSQNAILKPIQRQGRTAGDVLNDIGSMLADLTDELDAMLHMDQSENSNPSSSNNNNS